MGRKPKDESAQSAVCKSGRACGSLGFVLKKSTLQRKAASHPRKPLSVESKGGGQTAKKSLPSVPDSPQSGGDDGMIVVRGARQNNLKGFDLEIPVGKLNVVTGPSGSGKSSLAFDTIYAEGQRRYVETFSPYTRQFLERMDKPKVDEIRGIPPAIAIEQANPVKTTRSTVGTITEINDYLKLLMPRVVEAFCPSCQRQLKPETPKSIVAEVFGLAGPSGGSSVLVTFGVPVPVKTDPGEFFGFLKQQGYLRVWLEGRAVRTDEAFTGKRLPAVVPVIQDRVTVSEGNRARLTEAVETALRFGKGRLGVVAEKTGQTLPFSTGWHCAHCDVEVAAPTPGMFSFNHPLGACPKCRGFGRTITIDLERAVPDRGLSIAKGAVKPFQTENGQECQRDLVRCAGERGLDLRIPFEELPEADRHWVFHGERSGVSGIELWESGLWYGIKGFFDWLETKAYKMHVRVLLSRYRAYGECPDCSGGRYQAGTLNFRFAGKTMPELAKLPLGELRDVLAKGPIGAAGKDATTALLLGEVCSRLGFLLEVGLDYLSLDRPTRTLSGGEIERVNLTTCLGASLVNTLFVLDEPSVGLHPRDTGRLIGVMESLRDKGNTLLVVEHEEAVIRAADNLIEIGPGRGEAGGDLVFSGPLSNLLGKKVVGSLTADYLSGRKSIPVPSKRRKPRGFIRVEGAQENNLRDIDVEIPLGVMACVSGVSGSGKSTLVHEVLFENLQALKGVVSEDAPGICRALIGAGGVDQVVMVDQSPLSRTPRSTPAVYLGVFDLIRDLFAGTPDALAHGYSPGSFSFNSGAGRCERCTGSGFEKIEMQFLSDVFVRCPECEGKRYRAELLEVELAGKNIHDILSMTVAAAIAFFSVLEEEGRKARGRKIVEILGLLEEVGLGYLTLGQPLNVLSGGESQRLKLVERLAAGSRGENAGRVLLIFDEPTTGLHFDDVAQLLHVFDRLVEDGNSLLVIEHNLEVLKCADYLIDLGPEAGTAGGLVVAAGTPEQVAQVEASHTGRYLRGVLAGVRVEEPSARVAEVAPAISPVPAAIRIVGAREHNLKNISLNIPRGQMVIITGLSGSGKSTLAFDLLFAEGQRRFLDSMSAYARQFVEQLEKPDVDLISGLPPSVAIEQRITRGGGKSTVATVTEVYHFLRLLFAKLGVQYCPKCDVAVEKQTLAAIEKKAETLARKGRLRVLAPLVKARKGFHQEVAVWAQTKGFSELLIDGKLVAVDKFQKLERFREHTIDVVVATISTAAAGEPLKAALKRALEIGKGTARLLDSRGRMEVLSTEMSCPDCGQSFEELDPRMFSFNSPHGWCLHCNGFGEIWKQAVNPRLESAIDIEMDQERQHEWLEEGEAEPCPVCEGARLNAVARNVRLNATSIDAVGALSAREALEWSRKQKFTGRNLAIAGDILPEIEQRLKFMGEVGLEYLALNRSAKTLSGGESQRIRLAAQLGSNLRGVLYVLDEPTIGLHPRDNEQLLETLEALKRKGNSLIIVEHDEETMRRADTIIDLGPGAGSRGGEVVAQGTLAEICRNKRSATGRCLREPLQHPTRGERRSLKTVERWLGIKGASLHNLKNVDVRFPIGRLSVLTGISGSGKSTLMRGVLKPAVEAALSRKRSAGRGAVLEGGQFIEAVYEVDQSPIGKTSRSTPATYIKVFDEIRKLYAQVPLARMRGYTASRFSFNTEGGRCETCAGQGVIKVEMNFLPTSYVPCHECVGSRYNAATLEVLYNDQSIGDVMDMTLEQASAFFAPVPKVARSLALLCDTGLGYLKLGQPSPTLSGGEAQRLKLASELTRGMGRAKTAILRQQRQTKSMLYLLEEPTIGLHMADVCELLKVLHRLVDEGHTVVVIEHNLSLIAEADYLIDIGPEAGARGGEVVACGTPEQVAKSKRSRTAPFLAKVLAGG